MVTAEEIVEAARAYAGSPYRWWTGAYPEYGPPGYMDADPEKYTPAFVRREGVHCSGFINLVRAACGLEPVGLTKAYYDWLYEDGEWFDPSAPGVPGAICVHPWEEGLTEGHVALYTGDHTIIQAEPTGGVWEGDTDYGSHAWADYWLYGLMPDVDYGNVPEPAPAGAFTAEMLTRAMTSTSFAGPDILPADAARYLPHLLAACRKYRITTRPRLAAFLAQTGAESGSFRWWREFGLGEGREYYPYYGRGPMQLTWRANYLQYEDASGHEVVDNPDMVADDTAIGFDSAAWFWHSRDLNSLADAATWQSFYAITGRVWGQAGPFAERDSRYQHAWDTLPGDLDLTQSEEPEPEPEPEMPAWKRRGWINLSGYFMPEQSGRNKVWGEIGEDGIVRVRDWQNGNG